MTLAGMSGVFELNVMMPVIAYNLLQSIEILAAPPAAGRALCRWPRGHRERAAEMVEKSLAMVTALAPQIGYDRRPRSPRRPTPPDGRCVR